MGENIRVVELFAGVGGFRVGLEASSIRFSTIWANQWEPGRKNQFAFDCYNTHFAHTKSINVNEDIEKVKAEVPEHDLLVGGFPCQDYSVAATKARGIEGKKGVLWWSIKDIIHCRKPKYVLLENVDRLIKSPVNQRGRDFGVILRCLADEGYYVEWRVINAEDYGLQQRRRRTFIFACRKDLHFADCLEENDFKTIVLKKGFFARTFPVKDKIVENRVNEMGISRIAYPTLLELSNNFSGTFYNAGVMMNRKIYTSEVRADYKGGHTTLRQLLETDVDERFFDVDIEKWRYMKGAKKELRTDKTGFTYLYSEGSIPFPDILDRPGRTMLTSEGTPNRSSHIILDPNKNRYRILTPVECERLNGFPDDWTNTGMTERQRYFTMGNALVVQLIERMGSTIAKIIEENN